MNSKRNCSFNPLFIESCVLWRYLRKAQSTFNPLFIELEVELLKLLALQNKSLSILFSSSPNFSIFAFNCFWLNLSILFSSSYPISKPLREKPEYVFQSSFHRVELMGSILPKHEEIAFNPLFIEFHVKLAIVPSNVAPFNPLFIEWDGREGVWSLWRSKTFNPLFIEFTFGLESRKFKEWFLSILFSSSTE